MISFPDRMGLPLIFSVFSCFDITSLFTAISVKLSLRSRLYGSLQSIGVRAKLDQGHVPRNSRKLFGARKAISKTAIRLF